MAPLKKTLTGNVDVRVLASSDARHMKDAYLRNRAHLAPWEPERSDDFFTAAGQSKVLESKLASYAAGLEVPWVLLDGELVIGAITLSGIVGGPFCSANVGYWVDHEYAGRGIGSAALQFVLAFATNELELHRIQAATLLHNAASQKILQRAGFEKIGMAPAYLNIAGAWQDHNLYQRILY
ncbi:GNAT family N-acetyltransferase [Pseudarthrobacter sp. NPDC058329]|uniref:GNAT family N-acetyltransferase n=1 Tax=Pseudarthrobacter sp. NPDC058329 TaxID=3346448 RepID=UPI0036DCF3D2